MSHIQCISPVVLALILASATLADDKRVPPAGGEKAAPPRVLRIGAVASAPSAVTVFENFRRYFDKTDLPVDYVLYSNYDSLVDALKNGHVDICGTPRWPTPDTTWLATERVRRS
jgi:ABC-type phosphate/phosphonate transport system substrate-binding protein